jgi:hypothetical protein
MRRSPFWSDIQYSLPSSLQCGLRPREAAVIKARFSASAAAAAFAVIW